MRISFIEINLLRPIYNIKLHCMCANILRKTMLALLLYKTLFWNMYLRGYVSGYALDNLGNLHIKKWGEIFVLQTNLMSNSEITHILNIIKKEMCTLYPLYVRMFSTLSFL